MRLSQLTFAIGLILLSILTGTIGAQTYNPFNQRDDTYRLLGLKRSIEAYETARVDYERQQQLFDSNLITRLELDQARTRYIDAEVNYQQSLLAVLFEKQYITVEKAVKFQASDGRKHVRLTIANTSGGSAEMRKLVNIDDKLFRALQPDVINNIYVSILNDDQAIVSQPYESKIDRLKYGEPAELDFVLLQDLDAVTISIIYANGNQRAMKIFLQKDASVNRVLVQSEQFSQEVELGKTASFDLTLELFSGVSNTFSLEVVNLPAQIGRYFQGQGGSVRLSQVKFTESARTKRASLEVNLPDRPTDEVSIDRPIPFYVLIIPRKQAGSISDLHTRAWTESELDALEIGYVRLELVPQGKGELMVRLPQLYHAIDADETASMMLEVFNEGSHRVDNIEVRVDLPLNWTKLIDPQNVPSVEIGRDARINLAFTPPDDIAPGKYEIRVRTSGISDGQPISAEDKTVTVEIRTETNLFSTILIIVLLLGLVGGIVIYGVRLSRR